MGWVSGTVVFFLIWWIVIFMVLPWGNKRDNSQFSGAGGPVNPRIKEKFLITTGISLLVWLLVFALVRSDIISFRDISQHMIEEDHK